MKPKRFNLYMTQQDVESMKRLTELTGSRSSAETIRHAIRISYVINEALAKGCDLYLVDRITKQREKVTFI